MMNFRLVDSGWDRELDDALRLDGSSLRIMSPFIKHKAAERFLARGRPEAIQVITRFDLNGFLAGVSDVSALRLLHENGAQIRGIRRLHSKLYLFGNSRAIGTSANLTEAALLRNLEFGFVADDASIFSQCGQYFDELWRKAETDLTTERLIEWEEKITNFLAASPLPARLGGLGDEGVDVGITPEPVVSSDWVGEALQAFVKFFGEGSNRADRSMSILDAVQRAGCHWACPWPKGKRPRQLRDGAVMFTGRLVKQPNDVLVFGRAVGMRHEPGRDDATAADVQRRPWKVKWPYYVRVHHAEFIAGDLWNGISLNELMDMLGADAFASTQRNARGGVGNTDPRRAYRQQAAVELSPQGFAWLNERLERAYARHGKLPAAALERLDWPALSLPTGVNSG